jgi:hypothetical protein
MRRAFILAALAAPVLASAQLTPSPGQVIPTDPPNSDTAHGLFIDADECIAANGRQVELSWSIPSTSTNVTYEVWAANQSPTGTGTGGTAGTCNTIPNQTNSYTVGQVGDPLTPANPNGAVSFEPYPAATFVTAAGYTCSDTALRSIYVCVQAKDGNTSANLGIAQVTLTLSTARPGPPTGVTATPADDTSLKVSWSPPTSSPSAADYVVTWSTNPNDPSPAEKTDITSTTYTVTGLQTDTTYTFKVYARTNAGSRSTEFGSVAAAPVPVADFWDAYQAAGGKEQGGCAAGAAGPVALLGVAALLAALRRRS